MYYLSGKFYKPIMVQYYITDCVIWAPRLTLLDLRNVLSEWNSFVCKGLTIHWSCDLQNEHASWDQACTGLDSVTIDIAAPKAKHVYMWIWKLMRRSGSVSAHRLELPQSFLAPARWTPIPPSAPLQMPCDLQLMAEAAVQIVRPLFGLTQQQLAEGNITATRGQVITCCTWLPKSTLKKLLLAEAH